jgi:hypothetical protein
MRRRIGTERRPGGRSTDSRGAPRHSLRLKLGILFSVLAAVAVMLPASIQAYLQLGDARSRVGTENLALARIATAIVEEVVLQTQESLAVLAASPDVVAAARDGDVAAMTAYLEAAAPGDNDLTSISALDTQGRVWAISLPSRAGIGIQMSARPHVQRALRGLVPPPGPPMKGTSGHPIVGITAPIRGPDGQVVGALAGALSLYRLSEQLSSVRVGEEGFINLFAQDGTVLTHPEKTRILQPVWHQNDNILRALAFGESVMETRNYRGVAIFSAAVPIARLGWVVQAQIPVDEALSPFRNAIT